MSKVEWDINWLKKDTLEHFTTLDSYSQRHQESLCQLNRSLSNITNKIAVLTQEVGELGSRVTSLQRSLLTKRSIDLTETDSKKRAKVEKNTEE